MVDLNPVGLSSSQATTANPGSPLRTASPSRSLLDKVADSSSYDNFFSPNNLMVSKRHTRILGTLNKRADKAFVDE